MKQSITLAQMRTSVLRRIAEIVRVVGCGIWEWLIVGDLLQTWRR